MVHIIQRSSRYPAPFTTPLLRLCPFAWCLKASAMQASASLACTKSGLACISKFMFCCLWVVPATVIGQYDGQYGKFCLLPILSLGASYLRCCLGLRVPFCSCLLVIRIPWHYCSCMLYNFINYIILLTKLPPRYFRPHLEFWLFLLIQVPDGDRIMAQYQKQQQISHTNSYFNEKLLFNYLMIYSVLQLMQRNVLVVKYCGWNRSFIRLTL